MTLPLRPRHPLLAIALAAALFAAPVAATAQGTPAEAPPPVPTTQVGDATQQLLALQREGRQASPAPRPIAGELADRSYQRYLKSFDHPIPERFNSTVRSGRAGGSGGGVAGTP